MYHLQLEVEPARIVSRAKGFRRQGRRNSSFVLRRIGDRIVRTAGRSALFIFVDLFASFTSNQVAPCELINGGTVPIRLAENRKSLQVSAGMKLKVVPRMGEKARLEEQC